MLSNDEVIAALTDAAKARIGEAFRVFCGEALKDPADAKERFRRGIDHTSKCYAEALASLKGD